MHAHIQQEYGYVMTGNVYGNTNVSGGYFGTASYINTGSTTIKTKTNILYGSKSNAARVDRSHGHDPNSVSPIGAPYGPLSVCITDVENGVCSGDDREFPPSAYKFSLFGSYMGPSDNAYVNQFISQGQKHFGFRTMLRSNGFDFSTLQVNGRAYDQNRVNEDVTTVELDGLHYEFPKKYNLGSLVGAKDDGVTIAPLIETKTVHIRVHGLDSQKGQVYIDYIFELDGIANERYFIYDPDVTVIAGDGDSPDAVDQSHSVRVTAGALVAPALFIVTMLLAEAILS
jgi:hypothetical protein